MINLQPKTCNLCGGDVIFTSNSKIYGKEYGSGKMYYCTQCGAYVGTHKPRPTEALGLLADRKMRDLKKKCHALFDEKWLNAETVDRRRRKRKQAYRKLAKKMGIPVEECHFGYFDEEKLQKAYDILSKKKQSKAESEDKA